MSKDFIKNLNLDLANNVVAKTQAKLLFEQTSGPTAYVVAGSLVCFSDDVSSQDRSDVCNSTLLAQLVADVSSDRLNDVINWYDYYAKMLNPLGWNIKSLSWNQCFSGENSLFLKQIVVDVASSIATQEELQIIEKTLAALEKLPEFGDARQVFDYHTSDGKFGNFQIIVCSQDDINVQAKIIPCHYDSTVSNTDVLFFDYKSADISVYMATQSLYLNENIYDGYRQAVQNKLASVIENYICELSL